MQKVVRVSIQAHQKQSQNRHRKQNKHLRWRFKEVLVSLHTILNLQLWLALSQHRDTKSEVFQFIHFMKNHHVTINQVVDDWQLTELHIC